MPLNFLRTKKTEAKTGNEPVIVVSGLPRSGTSMMMKMLEAGGIPIIKDDLRQADESNPKGYYEFERVKKLKDGDVSWLDNAEGKAVKVISALLEHLPAGHHYKVIFMRRKIEEILASQKEMLVRLGEESDKVSSEKLAELFSKHLTNVELWLAQQPNIDVLYIHYNEFISNPDPQLKQMEMFLGSGLDLSKMKSSIDRDLYRQRSAQ